RLAPGGHFVAYRDDKRHRICGRRTSNRPAMEAAPQLCSGCGPRQPRRSFLFDECSEQHRGKAIEKRPGHALAVFGDPKSQIGEDGNELVGTGFQPPDFLYWITT